MHQDYCTIATAARASFTEKRSEFIGALFPCSSNDEAVARIQEVRAEHRKARHHVYAYILRQDHISRYSDDGEPQGTGGVPVLDVLQKQGLTDLCCVVTRYFGGILLGGGGLVRAYSHAASLAVQAAQRMEMRYAVNVRLELPYTLYGRVNAALSEQPFPILQDAPEFGTQVAFRLLVPAAEAEQLKATVTELTNGTAVFQVLAEQYADFAQCAPASF